MKRNAFAVLALTLACGDSRGSDGGSGSATGTDTDGSASATTTMTGGSASASDSKTAGDASADGTMGDGDATLTSPTDTDGTATASTSTTEETMGDDDTGSSDSGGCNDEGGVLFSYIWIANSTQGTVSKIDTMTATEVGRYLVGDYGGQQLSTCQGPSRTSVNLQGDVAVLDRRGGLAKIIANAEACPDLDNDNVIETSSDANYLPWQTDECLAWRIDVPHDIGNGCGGPRAVQWTAHAPDENCDVQDPDVWVAFCNENDNDVTVWLVDGGNGSVKQEYAVPDYGCATYGPYGGAVDAENNFWFVDRGSKQSLYRVEYGCVPANPGDCVEEHTKLQGVDAYGITIDPKGRLWMAGGNNSLYNYDPALDTWTSLKPDLDAYFANDAPPDANANNTLRGLMVDEEGVLWIASIAAGAWNGGSNPGLLRVDPDANPVEIDFYGPATLTGIQHAAGISIDVEGYVWLVDTLGNQAFKIDPVNPSSFTVVGGLQYPYTYSDMTGFALKGIVPQ